jgi:hypothetical protein
MSSSVHHIIALGERYGRIHKQRAELRKQLAAVDRHLGDIPDNHSVLFVMADALEKGRALIVTPELALRFHDVPQRTVQRNLVQDDDGRLITSPDEEVHTTPESRTGIQVMIALGPIPAQPPCVPSP